jgi:seryl-tRNA synthetase
MNKTQITLDKPLSSRYAQELAKRVFFVSERITDFRLISDDSRIYGVEVITDDIIDVQEFTKKFNYIVEVDVTNQKNVPPKLLWKAENWRDCVTNVFEQMVKERIATVVGEGQVCLGEPFITLMNYFDRCIKQHVIRHFNAQEYQYPTLIPTSVLQTCGYFDSFPHFLMFVTRLHGDIDTYRTFHDEYSTQQSIETFLLSYCKNTDYCLPPTMCFHTYHQYRDHQLSEDENLVVTSRGKSFRFESKYHHTLERLWDFTIREIVFMGSKEFVLQSRKQFMQHTFQMMEELGLAGFCEIANDPFFCNEDTASKIWSQKILELKYELRLNVAEDRTIAVSSFNFHEDFFGKAFAIRRGDSEWIKTTCVGFGLERLVYAFLCQYGLDMRQWPRNVVEGIQSAHL